MIRKGSDTRLVLKFLIDYLDAPLALDDVSLLAFHALQGLDSFLRICYINDRTFLRASEAMDASRHLKQFLVLYERAARLCYTRKQVFFNLTPKYHIALHICSDLEGAQSVGFCFNPACFATQSAEDFVGKVSRLGRLGHARTVSQRTCERWLMRAWTKWAELKI